MQRLAHHADGAAPGNHAKVCHATTFCSIHFYRVDIIDHPLEFAEAFSLHGLVIGRRVAGHANFVVFEAGGNVHAAGCTRIGHRRNAVLS